VTQIIITDLTRFRASNPDVCTAGVDLSTERTIRPIPYLKYADFERLNMLPGAIIEGDFQPLDGLTGPHQEDHSHGKLKFIGPSSAEDFKSALEVRMFGSIEEALRLRLETKQKHIPIDHQLDFSLFTIKVNPKHVRVAECRFNVGKLKLNFRDDSGRWFNYLPITDLGFHNYAQHMHEKRDLQSVNEFLQAQDEIYLRIGLSRSYAVGDRQGYWIQVNGIYTFPNILDDLRSYQ
jgi:hypothetical protein